MKKFFALSLLILAVSKSFGQNGAFEGRVGLSLGLTNYIVDTDLLFSKSGTGFTVGVLGSADFSERAELFLGIEYSRHNMKFVGKETATSPQEDLKFFGEQISAPILFNYNYLFLSDDMIKLGVIAGPSFHFYHNFNIKDDSKSGYVLEPLLINPGDLRFDDANEQTSFNVFGSVGLTAQYDNLVLAQLKYSRSITDPYRQAPFRSNFVDISGTEAIISFMVTYFLF